MSIFLDHPRTRWALPVAAVGVIGAVALTVNQTANADSGLPSRTAAQLLADVRTAERLEPVRDRRADLGPRPARDPGPGRPGAAGSATSSLTSLVSGTHTWRIWLDGPHTPAARADRRQRRVRRHPQRRGRLAVVQRGQVRRAPQLMPARRAPARPASPAEQALERSPGPAAVRRPPHAGRGRCPGPRRDGQGHRGDDVGHGVGRGPLRLRAGPHPEGQDHPRRIRADRHRQPGARPAARPGLLDEADEPGVRGRLHGRDFAKPDARQFAFTPPAGTRSPSPTLPPAPTATAGTSKHRTEARSAPAGRRHAQGVGIPDVSSDPAGARSSWPRSASRPPVDLAEGRRRVGGRQRGAAERHAQGLPDHVGHLGLRARARGHPVLARPDGRRPGRRRSRRRRTSSTAPWRRSDPTTEAARRPPGSSATDRAPISRSRPGG